MLLPQVVVQRSEMSARLVVHSNLDELNPKLVGRHAHLYCGSVHYISDTSFAQSKRERELTSSSLLAASTITISGSSPLSGAPSVKMIKFIGLGLGYPAGLPSMVQFLRSSR